MSGDIAAIALLGVAIASTGCGAATQRRAEAPSFRIADADLNRDPRAASTDEALEDLGVAARVFDEAYAGVDGHPRTPPERDLAAARARIAARSRWSPADLAGELRATFRRPDGHLAFGYDGTAPLHLPAWPLQAAQVSAPIIERVDATGGVWLGGDRVLLSCEAGARPVLVPSASGRFVLGVFTVSGSSCLARRESEPSATPLELLLRAGTARSAVAGDEPVELRPGLRWGLRAETVDEIPVLAIRTFDSAARSALEQLPAIAARLRAAPSFVVDLRGNGGGNFGYAEAFVLALTDATLRSLDAREVTSVAASEGRANRARRRLALGGVPDDARPVYDAQIAAVEAEAEALRAAGGERLDRVVAGGTVTGTAPGPLRSRAVFLVDRGCASACEMMVALARQIPGAIVAGENTRGGMAAGELALFRLPRSGVTISLGTRAFRDPLGGFEETRGYLPDLWIDGPDALDEARQLARGDVNDRRGTARLRTATNR